jgi:hypothetical protein
MVIKEFHETASVGGFNPTEEEALAHARAIGEPVILHVFYPSTGATVGKPSGYLTVSRSLVGALDHALRIAEWGSDKAVGGDFGDALDAMKYGSKKVARKGWNGKGMWLELQVPDAYSKMTLPYIWVKTADDQKVPWLASQTDMLANDWVTIE